MRTITRNAIRCNSCETVIESKHRHDFNVCPCGDIFIDGGLAYIRYGFAPDADFTLLTEHSDEL